MAGNVRINGNMYSWADVVITFAGVPLSTVTSLSYSENPNKENVYGSGGQPIGKGRGNTEYEASITIAMDELRDLAKSPPTGSLSDVPDGTLTVTVLGIQPFSNALLGCSFNQVSVGASQGDTSIGVDVDLLIGGIDWVA